MNKERYIAAAGHLMTGDLDADRDRNLAVRAAWELCIDFELGHPCVESVKQHRAPHQLNAARGIIWC